MVCLFLRSVLELRCLLRSRRRLLDLTLSLFLSLSLDQASTSMDYGVPSTSFPTTRPRGRISAGTRSTRSFSPTTISAQSLVSVPLDASFLPNTYPLLFHLKPRARALAEVVPQPSEYLPSPSSRSTFHRSSPLRFLPASLLFFSQFNPTGAEPVPESPLLYVVKDSEYLVPPSELARGTGVGDRATITFEAGKTYRLRFVNS